MAVKQMGILPPFRAPARIVEGRRGLKRGDQAVRWLFCSVPWEWNRRGCAGGERANRAGVARRAPKERPPDSPPWVGPGAFPRGFGRCGSLRPSAGWRPPRRLFCRGLSPPLLEWGSCVLFLVWWFARRGPPLAPLVVVSVLWVSVGGGPALRLGGLPPGRGCFPPPLRGGTGCAGSAQTPEATGSKLPLTPGVKI